MEENWAVLDKAVSLEVLKAFRLIGQLKDLSKYGDDQIWEAIQKKIQGTGEPVVLIRPRRGQHAHRCSIVAVSLRRDERD